MTEQAADSVEQVLRDALVRGDAVLATAGPILRHLLTNDDSELFSDEMIARVRGMVLDLAEQLLSAQALAAGARDGQDYVARRHDGLAQALFADGELVAHAHALTIEAHLLERLSGRSGIDPVLAPFVEQLVGAPDAGTAGLAMALIAAQARFQQHCRRMELPLRELPGELFHRALVLLREQAGADDQQAAELAETQLRKGYDEGSGRLGLIARLVTGLDDRRALAVDRAGLAIFASAVAIASGQERDVVILSLAEPQGARIALALRAAGFDEPTAVEQLLHFHPGVSLPRGFEELRSDRAAALLAASQPRTGL